jgi:hypothetical protein
MVSLLRSVVGAEFQDAIYFGLPLPPQWFAGLSAVV